MSETSRRGFFRTLATGVAALAASRAVSALPVPVVALPHGARTHAALKQLLGEDKYLSWFCAMRVGDCDGRTLHASVPVKFIKNWIDHHYTAELLAAARTEFSSVEHVLLVARGADRSILAS